MDEITMKEYLIEYERIQEQIAELSAEQELKQEQEEELEQLKQNEQEMQEFLEDVNDAVSFVVCTTSISVDYVGESNELYSLLPINKYAEYVKTLTNDLDMDYLEKLQKAINELPENIDNKDVAFDNAAVKLLLTETCNFKNPQGTMSDYFKCVDVPTPTVSEVLKTIDKVETERENLNISKEPTVVAATMDKFIKATPTLEDINLEQEIKKIEKNEIEKYSNNREIEDKIGEVIKNNDEDKLSGREADTNIKGQVNVNIIQDVDYIKNEDAYKPHTVDKKKENKKIKKDEEQFGR